MRKLLVIIWLMTLTVLAGAGPAIPRPVKIVQPDGSTIVVRIHGDEYFSWYTSEDGRTVYEMGEDKWLRPSSMHSVKQKLALRPRAHIGSWGNNGNGLGNRHIPVFLVEFSDFFFQEGAATYFNRALNEQGFSDNGQYGSVNDYYVDASYGLFTPEFDVYGPIRLERSYYEKVDGDSIRNFLKAAMALTEAMIELDPSVDFSGYDYDNDGYIDSACLICPGMDQSWGGGPDAIWGHQGGLQNNHQLPNDILNRTYDGKKVNTYFYSSEIHWDGVSFCTIGEFCHEFGHSIGLPDLYDVDSEQNGNARNPHYWDIMANGPYKQCPPSMSALERYLLGYIKELEPIDPRQGTVVIPGLDSGKAYILPTLSENEFFLFETRNGLGWDSDAPSGLLVYHIDASLNQFQGTNAAERWNVNGINCYSDHPCCYIVSPDQYSEFYETTFYLDTWRSWTFPTSDYPNSGGYYCTERELKDWSGNVAYRLENIQYDKASNQASFDVTVQGQVITGFVRDKDGNPIQDAAVFLSSASSRSMRKSITRKSVQSEALAWTTTTSDGQYTFKTDSSMPENLVITVFGRDCLPQEAFVEGHYASRDFTLESVFIESSTSTLSLSDLHLAQQWGIGSRTNYTVAQKFSASMLKDYAGKLVKHIKFGYYPSCDELWVFIDAGKDNRVLVQQVPDKGKLVTDVELSSNFVIPQGQDIYVGYMIKTNYEDYPVVTDNGPAVRGGFLIYNGFSTTEAGGDKWGEPAFDWGWDCGNAVIVLTLEDYVQIDGRATLADFGISYIEAPSDQLHAGDSFPLKLVQSPAVNVGWVRWFVDGKETSDDSVTLSAGEHTIKAEMIILGSSIDSDTVELTVNVL